MPAQVHSAADDRPSAARRQALRAADDAGNAPSVSSFFPLERYFDAADKVRTDCLKTAASLDA